tara:strand:- start:117 stop:518 length:402 start_codon:yes stop_codon:yes gene_type:complete
MEPVSKIQGTQEHVQCAETWADHINGSVINELTDVTPEEAHAAVMKYRALCDADYVEAFRIGEIPWLDTADREDIARMIASDRRKAMEPVMRAAPDLLDALQSLLAAFDSDFHDLMLAKMKAQAAIAKAKGGE